MFLSLVDLFTLPQDLTYQNGSTDDIDGLDPEEAGFQSSFSKLGASEKSSHDPVAQIPDARVYASKELARRSAEKPGQVSGISSLHRSIAECQIASLVEEARKEEQENVTKFTTFMNSNG